MTLSVLTSGALRAVAGRQMRFLDAGDVAGVKSATRMVRSLSTVTLSLEMAMLVM